MASSPHPTPFAETCLAMLRRYQEGDTYRQVGEQFGLSVTAARHRVRLAAKSLGLDEPKRGSARKWTNEQLKAAVESSDNWSEVARTLGLSPRGTQNRRTLQAAAKGLGIEVAHLGGAQVRAGQQNPPRPAQPLAQLLVKGRKVSSSRLAKRLVAAGLLEYKCGECELSTWRGKHLTLELDHINGDYEDNRLENLRLLCPNCHSQTDTWRGRKNRRPSKVCADCDATITRESTRCKSCSISHRQTGKTKIVWPDDAVLESMLKDMPREEVGRQLGVTGNSVKKHLSKTRPSTTNVGEPAVTTPIHAPVA